MTSMTNLNLPDLLAKAEAATPDWQLDDEFELGSLTGMIDGERTPIIKCFGGAQEWVDNSEYLIALRPQVTIPLLQWIIEAEKVLGEAEIQITYLHEKFGETGSGNAILAKLRAILGLQEIKGVGRG